MWSRSEFKTGETELREPYFPPIRMTEMRKFDNTPRWPGCGETAVSYVVWESIKWCKLLK